MKEIALLVGADKSGDGNTRNPDCAGKDGGAPANASKSKMDVAGEEDGRVTLGVLGTEEMTPHDRRKP